MVCGLLIVAATLVMEHMLQGTRASVVVAIGLSSCVQQKETLGSQREAIRELTAKLARRTWDKSLGKGAASQ